MTVVEGPGTFQRLDHVSIPLPDGTVLGARIWVPEGAETHKVPAILGSSGISVGPVSCGNAVHAAPRLPFRAVTGSEKRKKEGLLSFPWVP